MSALAKSAKKQLILAGDNLLDARVQLHDVYLLPLVLLLDIGRPRVKSKYSTNNFQKN